MESLTITHVHDSNPAQFILANNRLSKSLPAVHIVSPYDFKVRDMGDTSLMEHLRWYLEDFLQRPFPPDTDKAARIEQALKDWGKQAFEAIFDNGEAGKWLSGEKLHLLISSDDPVILSWPWEALLDPQRGELGHRAQIERRVNYNLPDPPELSNKLPRDRINILLVTARPYERDVEYRSISRALVEIVKTEQLPVSIDLLRPPTFDNLRDHLQRHPHYYHILHFDGHGGYGAADGDANHNEGCLIFEDGKGKPHKVSATDLTVLLMDHVVPVVVLNACQSAMLDAGAKAPFASVAAALLKAGARGVVAMAYSLYVKSAQKFLPPFYRALFESGKLSEAVWKGRLELLAHPHRTAINPELRFNDWLVPVLYQQEEFDFSFAKQAPTSTRKESSEKALPEIVLEKEDYTFVGRDGEILDFERALHRSPPGILVQGLGGIGKTTLAKACVRWLKDTNGIGHGCFWFGFDEIRSTDYVINSIGRSVLGDKFDAGRHRELLLKALCENQFLIVWDNFESVQGIEDTEVTANLSQEDQENLKDFLQQLRGGKTKILLTSRGQEKWLGGGKYVYPLTLRGLRSEEVWEYAAEILDDLGIVTDRDDAEFGELLLLLEGHPLLIRVVLLQLEDYSVTEVLSKLRHNLSDFVKNLDDAAHQRITGTFALLLDKIPEVLQDLLIPLSLHEKFIDANDLEAMAKNVEDGPPRKQIDETLIILISAGLLHNMVLSIYQIHPLLSSFLREHIKNSPNPKRQEAWIRAFVDSMRYHANYIAKEELHGQQGRFAIHNANFHVALRLAEKLAMEAPQKTLMQILAYYAYNCRDYITASKLYLKFAIMLQKQDDGKEVTAYHQLGMIASEQRDFVTAEKWYRKSLKISEKHGNEDSAANTCHQLGMIASEQHDFITAEKWYRKSLEIKETHDDEHGAASTYHQLGMIAQNQHDLVTAGKWFRKSLEIWEIYGDEHSAANTYHQLGIIAIQQHDFDTAGKWYRKSLEIYEKHGDEHDVADSYHQLGIIAQNQHDLVPAEKWFRTALEIYEKYGNERDAAKTYHHLGIIASEQRDFVTAEKWCRKSFEICAKCGDEHGAAHSYHQLGMIASEQRDFVTAEKWCRKSLEICEKCGDEHGAASSYSLFGCIAGLQGKYIDSGNWLIKSIIGFHNTEDEYNVAININAFWFSYKKVDTIQQAEIRKNWESAGLPVEAFEQLEEASSEKKHVAKKTSYEVPVAAHSGKLSFASEYSLLVQPPHKQSYLYDVWYGTNRLPVMDQEGEIVDYTNKRSEGTVSYGMCKVIIPESHQFGSIGSSWWRRWLRMTDDRLKINDLSTASETKFWTNISNYLSQLQLNERISVVFIHGYNVSFQDAAIRAAQIGFDLKIPGAMAFFSWPSKASPLAYAADEASIQASEDEISRFLSKFAIQTGSEKVHIIAHSMGNRGLLRAIQRITHDAETRSGIKFGQIILAAPDLDVDLFKDLARLYPSISERTTLYASAKDNAIAISQVIHGYDRAGFIPPVTVVPDIDTVEVTNVDLSLLGHGYIAEAEAVLYDMRELIFHNTPPQERMRLQEASTITASEPYWIINA